MENFLFELFGNKVLIIGIIGWATAQLLKFIIDIIVNKRVNTERLIGDGGMPSCHSATVSAMATTAFLSYGVGSFEFAVTSMLAIIVMHDAMGVRLETSKQAKVIKELTSTLQKISDLALNFSDEKLKDLVGHTPLQVFFGGALGVIVSLIFFFVIYA